MTEFFIPWNYEDLVRQSRSTAYYVKEQYDHGEISSRLDDFREGLQRNGSSELLEFFNVFYSALNIFDELNDSEKSNLWECMMICHGFLYNDLHALLSENIEADRTAYAENLKENRNILQMNVYLLAQMVERFENALSSGQSRANVIAVGRGKKTKKVRSDAIGEAIPDWEEQKTRLLQTLHETLFLPLHLLWSPPIVDDQFVNCVANICYKVFENVDSMKNKMQNEDCVRILDILIRNYRHQSVAAIKIIQQLQHFEHLSSVWAVAVAEFAKQGQGQLVFDIFKELSNIELDDVTKEGASAKNYANFLQDLGEKCPGVVLANMSLLLCHLDVECYTMRNAVLTILAQIVCQKLSGEHLDDKEKQNRDKCLDFLEAHLHDKNAFVRSKCFQLWIKLCEHNSIPKSRLKTLLPMVIGRLIDRGSTVRKGAIQLLTLILRNNPYMATLSFSEVERKLEEERQKLAALMKITPVNNERNVEHDVVRNADHEWEKIESAIEDTVIIYLSERFSSEKRTIDCDSAISISVEPQSVLNSVFNMLLKAEYKESCAFLVLARYAWPKHRIFQQSEEIPASSHFESIESAKVTIIELLKTVFLEHFVAKELAKIRASSIITKHNKNEDDLEDIDNDDEDTAGTSQDVPSDKDTPTKSAEIERQKKLVRYLKDSKFFAEQMQSVLPQVTALLSGQQQQAQSSADILESIDFVATCAEFGVIGSSIAIWKCLSLICSKEQTIRNGIIRAFERLYLKVDEETVKLRDRPLYIANQLIKLASEANISQRTSLEDVVCECTKQNLISKEVLQALWEKLAGRNIDERKASLKLIGMAAKAEKSIVRENFDLLVRCCLGDENSKVVDLELVRDLCIALEKLGYLDKFYEVLLPVLKQDSANRAGTKSKNNLTESQEYSLLFMKCNQINKDEESMKRQPFKLVSDNKLFVRLYDVLVEGFLRLKDIFWTPMMERAVKVIFTLANKPDNLAATILKGVYDKLQTSDKQSYALLTRFVALIGQVALQTFIFVDVVICRELKRRNMLEESDKEKKRRPVSSVCKKNTTADLLKTPRSTVSVPKVANEEEEMGLAGASAEDSELEFVNKVCEEEILKDGSLLGNCADIVLSVCRQQHKYKDESLQSAAALALSKLMIVSSKFCESHLSLFFTLLQKSDLPSVRGNLVIAVGDLSFRFPNLIEPWSTVIYKSLNDSDLNVRLNCLLILNYLILNDMIKPKGHIAEIAACTLDECPQVSALARKFLADYAEKGNSLYNLLPDIISRLSDPESRMKPEDFKAVMKFLFSLIHKERQYENLIEKLCQRFQTTSSSEHCRYFSYCLSLIVYNEKCLSKLNENLPIYAKHLGDDEVYSNFASILNAAKKSSKLDCKEVIFEYNDHVLQFLSEYYSWQALIDEMSAKFEQCHEKHLDDEISSSISHRCKPIMNSTQESTRKRSRV